MKPICVPCGRFMRVRKNGFVWVEGMPTTLPAEPGNPEHWRPYKLWSGDLWECPDCRTQVVVGVGHKPMAEHFEADFARTVEKFPPELVVNDS